MLMPERQMMRLFSDENSDETKPRFRMSADKNQAGLILQV